MKSLLGISGDESASAVPDGWYPGLKHGMRASMTSDLNDPNNRKPENPVGMGAPLAFLLIAGVVVGGLLGQPSIGLLVGAGLGILIAIVTWKMGRRK